jgi:hypothetical protein
LVPLFGKSAFSEFRKKDSEWFLGKTYVFAYDMKANVLLNPAFPEREGTNVTGGKDARGKLFHQAIIQTAERKGSGWVDYWFPKPGQKDEKGHHRRCSGPHRLRLLPQLAAIAGALRTGRKNGPHVG